MQLRLPLLALLAVLSACSAEEPATPTRKARASEATENVLAVTPIPRRYKIDGHDLFIIDVPSKDEASGTLEVQRCFLWRDVEYRTAALSCPPDVAP